MGICFWPDLSDDNHSQHTHKWFTHHARRGAAGALARSALYSRAPSYLWIGSSPLFGRSTQTLANSLGSGGANGGFNPLHQIGGPRSIQLALKLQFRPRSPKTESRQDSFSLSLS